MIMELSKQQEKDLLNYYNEYLSIGRDCTPVDFNVAEKVISELYKWGGLEKPHFYHFSSPMACELFINLICKSSGQLGGQLSDQLRDQLRDQLSDQLVDQLWDQLSDQLRDQLRDQLWDQLWDQLSGQLWDQLSGQLRDQLGAQLGGQLRGQLRAQLRDQLGAQLRDQLGAQLGGQLRAQLRDQFRGQLRDQLWDQLSDQLGAQLRDQLMENKNLSYMGTWFNGQFDSYWVSFYMFGKKIGVNFDKRSDKGLIIWNKIVESCHWFYPFANFCVVSDKPRKLNVDDRGRLHSYTEKAIEYSDGWGFYSVHGLVVPGWLIENPDAITAKKIENEQNVEIRRIMLDIFGLDKYLDGCKPIHQDKNGVLYRKKILDDEPLVMVKVKNSTPEPDGTFKNYFLRVPPEMKTAREAVAWTFDENPETYEPEIES